MSGIIPLYKPYMPDLPLLDEILHSGSLASGSFTVQFEELLKKWFKTENIIVTNTFSNAIFVTLSVFGIHPGDEVIMSPMACLVSTQPYSLFGCKIVWADVIPNRGTLDPESVRGKITIRTKAIIHNHYCGYPGYIDEINAIGEEYGIPVIDDGIEAFGSLYKGHKIGITGASAAIFSLSAVRVPNTIDGGVVVFRDKTLYEKSLLARDSGIDRLRFRDEIGEISPYCDIPANGFSATMSNINAYIGCQQMKCVDEILNAHRRQAECWKARLQSIGAYRLVDTENAVPNYWVFGILTDDSKRKTILQFREKGYYASGVHINNNIYSAFGKKESLPGVNSFYDSFVALPCGWWMNLEKDERIIGFVGR